MKDVKCDYRKMFGYPAYFINGNMFAGLFADKLFIRLSDPDIAEIRKTCQGVDNLEPMPGRPMKGYVALPKSVYSDDASFAEWLNKSVNYVSSLPVKQKKR
ncbi:MAG TPA: TfoX/Sxy family protein [Candidatus Nanoarchaeia archaeon]|nr:TfoX/Sxy family protein [Candidatus Nanoarchaeia archaeon]